MILFIIICIILYVVSNSLLNACKTSKTFKAKRNKQISCDYKYYYIAAYIFMAGIIYYAFKEVW